MNSFAINVSRETIEAFANRRDVNQAYTTICRIAAGTFGEVIKAKLNDNEQFVAIKKLPISPPHYQHNPNLLPFSKPYEEDELWINYMRCILREINILQNIIHPNIVRLLEVCQSSFDESSMDYPLTNASLYLVLEYCEFDLCGLLSQRGVLFDLAEKKMIMWQILKGLYALHLNGIMHRDLKTANILVTRTGLVKLTDFGMARLVSEATLDRRLERNSFGYTNPVVSLWYRAPEILLGSTRYGLSIDMWSLGCIMFELWTRAPAMPGINNFHQLLLINQICGSITLTSMPCVVRLNMYWTLASFFPSNIIRTLELQLRLMIDDEQAIKMIDQLLVLNPLDRLSAEEALQHPFFTSSPRPKSLVNVLAAADDLLHQYSVNRRN